ncbi:hypothetical protein QWY85_10915 [Neolewinella lacunae]|uniref:Uncharacterized protein n=1 Tax=Neolewinella lacunae TaxID=1517758 RepID=A0A923TC62_9BACT|nr:hypothetical protein [Neolewinella lacunae]MBC6993372.1 hypothetical protein [Neolewinella lacunae]MDN3635170.1 hypothetical protein [Neolewinella lacunae]
MEDLQRIEWNNEHFYKISNVDTFRPFFMSVVSDGNHWMFVASNGGISAGRKNAEYALFPYYTDDKITESAEITGSKSIFRIRVNGADRGTWEPFSIRGEGRFRTSRNLYKSIYGNKIIFEEINHDFQLSFQYQWSSSNQFGFIRTATLKNDSAEEISVELLDGLQNILPAGVPSDLQNRTSNLVDAYKRSELHAATGLGIYALSAIIVDKAEPSEALKANVVWSLGLDARGHLLSARQLGNFRRGEGITPETDVKGEKGAYFVHATLVLPAQATRTWTIGANVNQDHAALARLIQLLTEPEPLAAEVARETDLGTQNLLALCAAADALQCTADPLRDTRHFANVLFNIMRGGIFDDNYNIERQDLLNYLAKANHQVSKNQREVLQQLPEKCSLHELTALAEATPDPDFQRLCLEYLPLKFSRRHGDPSRPWNRFSINTHNESDGSKILDYEGNWRDIFQNWEALAHSYPDFLRGMIFKFVNASTFDGYNPYRVTKDGFDWETIEPDDPWSYIGYWGDHQIIYLLKLLELLEKHQPGSVADLFGKSFFVYANVPYRIKSYEAILDNPKDTIDFDAALDREIHARKEQMGADGALLRDRTGSIHRVGFLEKLLATLLAKLANFIPEGGIWMNTQRPEWNDANNALVGNGVSMVTLYYLRRFIVFFDQVLDHGAEQEMAISEELKGLFDGIFAGFQAHTSLLSAGLDDRSRKQMLDALGTAAHAFRQRIYAQGFSGNTQLILSKDIRQLLHTSLAFIDHSIRANKRADGLYHAYNLVGIDAAGLSVGHLSEMLEGQVAVLSAGVLAPADCLEVLDALKNSSLYRKDQNSYILYPDKDLPGFLRKNTVPAAALKASPLLREMLQQKDTRIITEDVTGAFHFNGNFKNSGDVSKALNAIDPGRYDSLTPENKKQVLGIFEEVFNHREFTGRSGTFFGYEGLGSIYWHMVSKLQLAVQECCLQAIAAGAPQEITGRLAAHYYAINEGIGVHKSPAHYGAFPTDPYSHTPKGKGAQQPGMTGQVKEDIISRFGELGLVVAGGELHFKPDLLRAQEFLSTGSVFDYIDLSGQAQSKHVPAGALCFTYCQVPITYRRAENTGVEIIYADGALQKNPNLKLDPETSKKIFARTGAVREILVALPIQNE